MSFFGRRSRQALEERLQRAALGLPPARRHAKAGIRSKRWSARTGAAQAAEAFSTCQNCGAGRLPGPNGKLPPHECGERR